MESKSAEPTDSNSARASLTAIAADRTRLGNHLKAQTWWTAPAQALAITAVIASPAAGIGIPISMVAAIATIAIVGIDQLFRKRTRIVTIPAPKGPVNLVILILLSVAMIGGFALAIMFEVQDQRSWLLVTAAPGFVIVLIGLVLYDVANARELLRVR